MVGQLLTPLTTVLGARLLPIKTHDLIAADITDYLSSIGFQFYRSDRVGFPDRELTEKELRMFKALAELYPYLKKHTPPPLV